MLSRFLLCILSLCGVALPAIADELLDDDDAYEDTEVSSDESSSSINVDAFLPPIDGTLRTSLAIDYTIRAAQNGMPGSDHSTYWGFGVADFIWQTQATFALNDTYSIRPKIEVGVGSGTLAAGDESDVAQVMPLLDVNQQTDLSGLSLQLRQYMIHLISKKHGILSVGRSETFDRAVTDFLTLGSGISNKFYQDVAGVRLYNRANKSYLGRFASGNGRLYAPSGEDGGAGLRLWGVDRYTEVYDGVSYALPYKDWLLQVAYSNVPGGYTDKYYQLGLRYTYDVLWARLSLLGAFASSWPSACQVATLSGQSESATAWANCQYTGTDANSPYRQLTLGSKFSLGYVDASMSYRRLFDRDSDATTSGLSGQVQDYYAGFDYTFMDATEFGPMSVGLGMMRQDKFASLVGQSPSAYPANAATALSPLAVKDSRSYGIIFSLNQKLGYNSGVKFYWEQYGFSAIQKSNSLKIKASPVRVAVLSLYTNIDQWHLDKRA